MEKILIMGLGRSGLAAAELLKGKAQLYAWDSKPEEKFAPEVIGKADAGTPGRRKVFRQGSNKPGNNRTPPGRKAW